MATAKQLVIDTIERGIQKTIRVHVERSGMSQKEIAEKMGMSPAALNKMTLGKTALPFSRFLQLVNIICIPREDAEKIFQAYLHRLSIPKQTLTFHYVKADMDSSIKEANVKATESPASSPRQQFMDSVYLRLAKGEEIPPTVMFLAQLIERQSTLIGPKFPFWKMKSPDKKPDGKNRLKELQEKAKAETRQAIEALKAEEEPVTVRRLTEKMHLTAKTIRERLQAIGVRYINGILITTEEKKPTKKAW